MDWRTLVGALWVVLVFTMYLRQMVQALIG